MSGYNRIEQAVGHTLTRFPRVKSAVEDVYQRLNYHAFADRSFEYDLHEDASIHTVPEWWGVDRESRQYVGFYDICPWNSTSDAFFVHELTDNESALIGLYKGDEFTEISDTRAWNYQQGSRTQWHPTAEDVLIFNDIEQHQPVSRFVTTSGNLDRTIGHPIQAVNPAGDDFLSINYTRLDRNSPGYGYGLDTGSELPTPSDDGIWLVGFDGSADLIIPLATLKNDGGATVPHEQHYLHHLRYSPDGERFVFLHRWKEEDRRHTRLYVSDLEGDIKLLSDNQYSSHFTWLDEKRIVLYGGTEEYGRGYYILDTDSESLEYISELESFGDGHPSVSPAGTWIVTDSYPNRVRNRSLTLFNLDTREVIPVGEFFAPFRFDGVHRCDLHPRWDPTGRYISIDSAHRGRRESFIIDVSELL